MNMSKKYEAKFPLGALVKDRITGFTGIVMANVFWLNGCVRCSVQPQELKDGKPIDMEAFDEQQLDLVKAKTEPEKPKRGGPMPRVKPF